MNEQILDNEEISEEELLKIDGGNCNGFFDCLGYYANKWAIETGAVNGEDARKHGGIGYP